MIAGNFEDKYNSKHPISKILVNGFLSSFDEFIDMSGSPRKILEVGCGEGYLTKRLVDKFPNSEIFASDISQEIARVARKRLGRKVNLSVQNVEKLQYNKSTFDLLICCEVLEHVKNPEAALSEIARVASNKIIISIPNEPLWRIFNISRGKYLKRFGNTPGHINHWLPHKFIKLLKDSGMKIISVNYPLPWIMVLAKK